MGSREQPAQHAHTIDDLPIGFGPGKIPTSDMVVVIIGTNGNLYLPVRNVTGGPLLKGRLVAVTGSVGVPGPGRRYTVDYADKDNPALRPASGVLLEDLPDGEDAYALTAGVLDGVDTSAFGLTDQLCLGTAGAFTRPPPDTDPFTGEVQQVGVVVRVGVADGSIQVLMQGLNVLTAAMQFNVPQTLGRGWQQGGIFTRGAGLLLDISGGVGFVTGLTPDELIRVIWAPQTILLAADSALSIYIDSAGIAQSNVVAPSADTNIILGRAFTEAASIPFLASDTVQIRERNSLFNQFASEVTGAIAVSGIIATPVGLGFDVSGGVFWANDDREIVPATVGATWTYWYRDGVGGWTALPAQAAVNTASYDDGTGVLAAIPAGRWKQDILYAAVPVGDVSVEYHVVFAQATFAAQVLAEAAPVPTPFALLQTHALRSTGLVVQQAGVAIASVVDQRPFLGGLATGAPLTDFSSITGTISDAQHGNRGGGSLHALVTGVDAGFMSSADFTKLGQITLASTLTTVGAFPLILTVTGATNVTLPTTGTLATLDGMETLTNKTLTTPTIGDFSNAQHDHANAAGGGTLALSVLTGSISDAQHGNRGGGALHSLATGLAAGFMSSADFTKLAGITPGAAVASVSGTAPIVSSGGTTPAISITPATTLAAGSMSAADKAKLDGLPGAAAIFSGAGVLTVVNNVGMWWWNRTGRTLTLTDVTMWRQQAGTTGSTIGDVELDAGGTGAAFASVYLPANRPTILFSTGSNAFVQANVFATTAVPNGAILRFNIKQVEGGSPQNILAQLTLQ